MRVVPSDEQETQWFTLAAEQAKAATCLRARCGSIIVKDGRILGSGYNAPPLGNETNRQCTTVFDNSRKPSYDTTCCVHAEWNAILDALTNAGTEVEGATLYFMRVDAEGNFTDAGEPFCTVCSRLSMQAGLSEFVLWNSGNSYHYDLSEYNLASYQPYIKG